MPRFFRRLAEGVFDEDDVQRRANELADFIAEARERYGLPAPIAVGYSNGANIAAAVLLLRPEALAGAVLLRPMMPLRAAPAVSLQGKPVLLLSGAMDPIATEDSTARLASALGAAGAQVQHRDLPAGHELSQADIAAARGWLASAARQPPVDTRVVSVGRPHCSGYVAVSEVGDARRVPDALCAAG